MDRKTVRQLWTQAERSADRVRPIRHDLHSHPELGLREHRTSAVVADFLTGLNIEVRRGVAKTGVVGVLRGARPGPVVALRADMDALPIDEATGKPYASRHPGVMHACGHDGHTAVLLGTADLLANRRKTLNGTVVFVFQPAEENAAGGRRMCEAGCLLNPPAEAVFALHGCPQSPCGTITVRSGVMCAQAGDFSLTVIGRDAHGAYPHKSVDPIVVAARIIDGLQLIVSRERFPHDAVVLSLGSIHAGNAPNRIPDRVFMTGTLRTLDNDVRRAVMRAVRRVAHGTAAAHQARCRIQFGDCYPPVVNDPTMTRLVRNVGERLLGKDCVLELEYPSMGGEDFAYYLQQVPGAMFRLGLAEHNQSDTPALHTDRFDFNDSALPVGVAMFAGIVLAFQPR